jgi:hypothetical protein
MLRRGRYWVLAMGAVMLPSLAARGAVATFQNGQANPFGSGGYAGTQDAMLAGGQGWGGYGSFNPLYKSGGAGNRAVISFDVSGLAGKYSAITSADLYLTQDETASGSGAVPFSLHAIADGNVGWIEGTSTGQSETGGAATWYYKVSHFENPSAHVRWIGGFGLGDGTGATSGYAADPAATGTYDYGKTGQTIKLSLPVSLIEHWITGPNAGLLIINDKTVDPTNAQFWSSEATAVANRPRLEIHYVPEPPAGSLMLIGAGVLAVRRRGRASSANESP